MRPFKGEKAMKRSKSGRGELKRDLKRSIPGYLFILPVVLGILFFTLVPMITSIYTSLWRRFPVIGNPSGFGFYNYYKIFTQDKEFWVSWWITIKYTAVSLPLTMILSFGVALLLNQKIRGIQGFRILFYLPVIIPATISGLLWRDFLDADFGLANTLLAGLGLPESGFVTVASSAMPTIIFLSFFGLGGGMVLWLAALKNVPEPLYESARIDGAGWWTVLSRITIPMCTNIIFYNFILGIINSLQTFASVQTLMGQQPAPENSLLFVVTKIYNTAFNGGSFNMAYASALAWVLFIVIAVLTAIVFKTSKWVYYGEDA